MDPFVDVVLQDVVQVLPGGDEDVLANLQASLHALEEHVSATRRAAQSAYDLYRITVRFPRVTRSMTANSIMRVRGRLIKETSEATGFESKECDDYGTFVMTTMHVDFLTDGDGLLTSSQRALLITDLKKQSYKPICLFGPKALMFCSADVVPNQVRQSMVVEFASREECVSVFRELMPRLM